MLGFWGGTGLSSLVSGDTTAAMGLHSLAWHLHQEHTLCRLKKEINLSNTVWVHWSCRWHGRCWWRGMWNLCWQVRACGTEELPLVVGMAPDGGEVKGGEEKKS